MFSFYFHSFTALFSKKSIFDIEMQNKSNPQLLSAEQLDDLNSCLNVILDTMKTDTSEFPPLELLAQIKQCLECLANSPCHSQNQRAKFVSLSWPADLRIVIGRLFRTFGIPEEYIQSAYELCNFAAQSLGADWLKSDSQFLCLLSSLSSGRLRIVLDEPAKVDIGQLIACLQLQEFFLKCAEDEHEWMSDDDVTFVGKCSKEAATFVCEYLAESVEEVNVNMQMELYLVLYRFICAFLAIGGAAIIDKELLDNALPTLIKVCRYCLSQHDDKTVWFLLSNLHDFNNLPNESLSLLIDHFGLIYSNPLNKEAALTGLSAAMEELKDRRNWFTERALDTADQLSKISRDRRLAELVQHIRERVESTAAEVEKK